MTFKNVCVVKNFYKNMTLQMYTEDVSNVEPKEQKSSSPIQPPAIQPEDHDLKVEKEVVPTKRKRAPRKQDKPKKVVKKQKKEIGTKRASHKMKKDPRSKQSLLSLKKKRQVKSLKKTKPVSKQKTSIPVQSLKSKSK